MKNGMMRMKVDFENAPLMDTTQKIKCPEDLDQMVKGLKLKLFGR